VALTRRRSGGRYVVAVLLLAALTLITLDARGQGNGALRSVRNAAHTVLTPVQSGIHDALRPVGNFITGAVNYGSLEAENHRLEQQLLQQQAALAETRYDQAQADQTLKLARIPFASGVATVPASVIDQPSSNFETTITINKGSKSGLVLGQPVVSTAGLAGKISAVTADSATVTLITDPSFVCGVALPAGNVGSATGQGQGNNLEVSVLPSNAAPPKLKDGQTLFTSALGGNDPPGIPVGTIKTVQSPAGESSTATVVPAVRTASLEYVDVMLWSPQ
jgi:rod shape-determining protein MreC